MLSGFHEVCCEVSRRARCGRIVVRMEIEVKRGGRGDEVKVGRV